MQSTKKHMYIKHHKFILNNYVKRGLRNAIKQLTSEVGVVPINTNAPINTAPLRQYDLQIEMLKSMLPTELTAETVSASTVELPQSYESVANKYIMELVKIYNSHIEVTRLLLDQFAHELTNTVVDMILQTEPDETIIRESITQLVHKYKQLDTLNRPPSKLMVTRWIRSLIPAVEARRWNNI